MIDMVPNIKIEAHTSRLNTMVEGGKKHKKGGLNCVFKNVSFLRKIALFSGFRV